MKLREVRGALFSGSLESLIAGIGSHPTRIPLLGFRHQFPLGYESRIHRNWLRRMDPCAPAIQLLGHLLHSIGLIGGEVLGLS